MGILEGSSLFALFFFSVNKLKNAKICAQMMQKVRNIYKYIIIIHVTIIYSTTTSHFIYE